MAGAAVDAVVTGVVVAGAVVAGVVVAGVVVVATGPVNNMAGAGSSGSAAGSSVGMAIQRISPTSHRCTNGKKTVVSGVGGNVIVTENVPSWSSGSGPPTKVTTSASIDPSHPTIGSGLASVTPSGNRMSSWIVGEPSQPCSTVNATDSVEPAWASVGSGSMWASAGDAIATAAMADAVDSSRARRIIRARS